MGRAIASASQAAREVFERADRTLGFDLSRICFEGPEDQLKLTATAQPAILATSIALLEALREAFPPLTNGAVLCAAGHSLGEYSALVAAGAIDRDDALRIVRRRGEYMQDAVPVGQGAMAAVLGATRAGVEALCRAAAEGEVLAPANDNAPDQIVVAGTAAAVRRLSAMAKEHGARRVVDLPVTAPFHCALMKPAQDRLRVDLAGLTLREARFPILQNVSARPVVAAEAIRKGLVEQVTAPVRWVETVLHLKEMGVTAMVEIGPGKVLSGLARKIAPDMPAFHVNDPESLQATLAGLSATGSPA